MPRKSDFRITKETVDCLPTDRESVFWDRDLKGFGVRVKPGGKKSYVVQYRNEDGISRRLTLGQHGAITPKEAEKLARAKLGEVAKGQDPVATRTEARKAETVKELCEAYLKAAKRGAILGKRGTPKKAGTLYVDAGRINRHILPLLGTRKARDLTTPDINRFMRDVAAGKTAVDVKTGHRGRAIVEGGNGTAARTVGLLGGIMSFAVSEGIISANPCRGVKRPADARREVRLSPTQYKALGDALRASEHDAEAWQAVAAFRLIALTGCRLGEAQGLKWSEVDLSGHALRLSDSKTGQSVRPIGAAVVKLLSDMLRSGPYVFPSPLNPKTAYGSLPNAWRRILARAVTTDPFKDISFLTPHGLRHAYASTGGDLGLTEITIAALLGHSAASVTGRYIHHLDTALIAAADRVAARIVAHMNGSDESGAVVEFRRA